VRRLPRHDYVDDNGANYENHQGQKAQGKRASDMVFGLYVKLKGKPAEHAAGKKYCKGE
jgi:hypothetical protein